MTEHGVILTEVRHTNIMWKKEEFYFCGMNNPVYTNKYISNCTDVLLLLNTSLKAQAALELLQFIRFF